MIDFTKVPEEFNRYRGSEKKKTLFYQNKKYLVKFPDPIQEKNKNISYINNAFSEYIGSHIFQMIGMETQNTILGKYRYNEKEKIVCACEDFTTNELELYEFELLAISSNPDKKIDTELTDILEVIALNSNLYNLNEIKEKFWDMFIIDALIGNTDRHNGNWGFLKNNKTKSYQFSPIYDCGSCLNPLLEDDEIETFSENEIKNLSINCFSCFKENGKKINFVNYISSLQNEDCNNALLRNFPKISLDEINQFIEEIECISKIRKKIYKQILKIRYEIIKAAYNRLKNENNI